MRLMVLRRWSTCFCLLTLTGCGETSNVMPVSGKITMNDKPVPNASVAFYPTEKGEPSFGVTNDDGTFELTVAGGQGVTGAKLGNHKVTVSAFQEMKQKTNQIKEDLGSIGLDGRPPTKRKSLLPIKYANVRTTDLSFEVKAGEENVADFQL